MVLNFGVLIETGISKRGTAVVSHNNIRMKYIRCYIVSGRFYISEHLALRLVGLKGKIILLHSIRTNWLSAEIAPRKR